MDNREKDLIYKRECYQIMGLVFEMYNNLGCGYKESSYQKALAETFTRNNIPFKEQLRAILKFKGKEIGLYILDFLVFDKIVLELKRRNYFSPKDIQQLYAYLKVTGLKLGIIIHFTNKEVLYKRVVNLT